MVYAPGILEAICYDAGGAQIARVKRETTGPAVALQLACERVELTADGDDTVAVTVRAVDAQGRENPLASSLVEFDISGEGLIAGVGNGDPVCHESDKAAKRSLFHGRAQVLVKSTDQAGIIHLGARSAQLAPARLELRSTPPAPGTAPAQIAVLPEQIALSTWQVSPVADDLPDPAWRASDNDMNSWESVTLASTPDRSHQRHLRGYRLYRSTFSRQAAAVHPHVLDFPGLCGSARLYVNGEPVFETNTQESNPSGISLPRVADGRYEVVVIFHSGGGNAGFNGIPLARRLEG